MEREYQLFCDRCGQRLNWSGFDNCEVRYIEWDGPEDEEESNASSKQVDDGNQEDTAKIERLKATVPRGSSISQDQKEISLVEKIVWEFSK